VIRRFQAYTKYSKLKKTAVNKKKIQIESRNKLNVPIGYHSNSSNFSSMSQISLHTNSIDVSSDVDSLESISSNYSIQL
jgi:hypothetical protein